MRVRSLVVPLLVSMIGAALVLGAVGVEAQTPPTPTATPQAQVSDAQQLAVERELLCPLCVNERLDVCTLAICNDMKKQVREQLAAGRSPDDIILFFETRYGPKVRAELPRQGFNLVLFGWVGGAIVLVGAIGAYALYTMRRDSDRRHLARAAATPGDDRWVDDLLDDSTSDATGDAPRGTR